MTAGLGGANGNPDFLVTDREIPPLQPCGFNVATKAMIILEPSLGQKSTRTKPTPIKPACS